MSYVYLIAAIICEVIATSVLKNTNEFRNIGLTIFVLVLYTISFYLLTLTLRTFPVAYAYAFWSALGIVLVAVAAVFLHKQIPDMPGILGMGLIVAGVVVINLFSKTQVH